MLPGLVCVPRQIAAWYYMKLLRHWRGDELFKKTLNSSESCSKCLLKFFFSKICRQNPPKASFMYQQWTTTGHIFLNAPYTDSLVFFSKRISRTAVLTQASVITFK